MIIIAFLALTLAGALAAVLTLVVICVQSEDRRGNLPGQAPTRATRAVRRLTGLRVCGLDQTPLGPRPMGDNATRRSDCAALAGSPTHPIGVPASARTGYVSPVTLGPAHPGRRSA